MKTVAKMIEELKKFPMNAGCYGYQGECYGLGIYKDGSYGFIPCGETKENEDHLEAEPFKK